MKQRRRFRIGNQPREEAGADISIGTPFFGFRRIVRWVIRIVVGTDPEEVARDRAAHEDALRRAKLAEFLARELFQRIGLLLLFMRDLRERHAPHTSIARAIAIADPAMRALMASRCRALCGDWMRKQTPIVVMDSHRDTHAV